MGWNYSLLRNFSAQEKEKILIGQKWETSSENRQKEVSSLVVKKASLACRFSLVHNNWIEADWSFEITLNIDPTCKCHDGKNDYLQ